VTAAQAPGGAPSVWPRTAVLDGGGLVGVGGVGAGDLVARFGTPLHVLDRAELVGRMRAYREAFAGDEVVYAAKALCVTGVLQLAAAEGLGVDVAGGGELATALHARVPPARIWLHGNDKSVPELRAAVGAGVGRIVADGFDDLARTDALAREAGVRQPVLLRITPGVEAVTHRAIATAGEDAKFGFSLSTGEARRAVDRALALPGLDLRGLHCHVGSQVVALDAFALAAERLVGLLADVRDRHGLTLPELNLGGGLGIRYLAGDPEVPLPDYATALREAVAKACAAHDLPVPRLVVEPGRSIAGPAGLTLYTVGTVKEVPGVRTFAAVDGGMGENPRPSLYGARYTFAPAGRGRAPGAAVRPTTVAGRHCESGDLLGIDVPLPVDLAAGDLLAMAATGAYAQSMASTYNRFPRPPVVLVADGDARVLVRGETIAEVLSRDIPLDEDAARGRPPA
jgi:diaminopimelate decarboxylase